MSTARPDDLPTAPVDVAPSSAGDAAAEHGRAGGSDDAADALDALVGEWMTLFEVADALRTSPNRVRQMVRDNGLAMLRTEGSREPRVPALMVLDGQVVKGLGGTLTLLADAGYDTREALGWLFSPEEALATRPIDALRTNRVHEVRRIAQALGF